MVFGLSWGEVALILGASAALFGPKDIVVIGRAAGRLTGKAVGYIQTARGHLDPILQRSEINTVHRELRETMAQLDAIRHEMRTGMSIMNPGPRTRGVMDTTDPELSTRFQTQENGVNAGFGTKQSAPSDYQLKSGLPQPFSHTELVRQMQELQSATKRTLPPISIPSNAPIAPPRSAPSSAPKQSGDIMLEPSNEEVIVLPISAVDAGLLPSNAEPLSGGADLVFASIIERKVAFESKKFFEEGQIKSVEYMNRYLDEVNQESSQVINISS